MEKISHKIDEKASGLFDRFVSLYNVLDKPWQPSSFLFLIMCLCASSVVFVYSASIATASEAGWGAAYAVKQAIYVVIGFLALFVVRKIPLEQVRYLAIPFLLLTVLFLVAVLTPGLGRTVNGASRWISFGVFNVQPSEMAKLAMVLFMADFCTRKRDTIRSTNLLYMRSVLIPLGVVLAVFGALLLLEPDFGSTTVVVVITLGLMTLAGLRKRLILVTASLAALGAGALIVTSPYRVQRFLGFMDPWADPYGKSYQLTHSLMAYGKGGVFGSGLGTSVEAQFYLPEAHTDFISAIIAEEMGTVGILALIAALLFVVMQCLAVGRMAIKQDKLFAGFMSMGIGIWFAFQTLVNLGVSMGMLPTKGITLPLMSYGGSGIILNLVALGLVLRASWENTHQTKTIDKVLLDIRMGKTIPSQNWAENLESRVKILKDPPPTPKKVKKDLPISENFSEFQRNSKMKTLYSSLKPVKVKKIRKK